MGYRAKQTLEIVILNKLTQTQKNTHIIYSLIISLEENLNGSEAPKQIFSILIYQGNANKNNPEIPPHTSQNC